MEIQHEKPAANTEKRLKKGKNTVFLLKFLHIFRQIC